MVRIIGDRKEKSALDEMEEVAKMRNRDVAEEERIETLRKAKEAERARAPSGKAVTPAGNITAADYHRLEFEAKAAKGLDHKALVSYDISLERLKMAGYERHASPAEAFSLLIDNLEGKLKGKYKAVAEDMLDDSGEWMSMAVERKGNTLICYLHPEGLAWDKEKKIYMHDGFNHSGMQECAISGKESTMWRPLDQFGNDFVKLLYGRSYNDLPEEMKEDISCAVNVCKTQVYLPPEDGNIWPVYRSNNNPLCVVCYKADGGASRGVREKPVVSAKKPNARQNNPAMPTSTLPGSFRAEHHLRG